MQKGCGDVLFLLGGPFSFSAGPLTKVLEDKGKRWPGFCCLCVSGFPLRCVSDPCGGDADEEEGVLRWLGFLNCGQVCSCLPSSGSCFVGVAIEWLFTWREQRPAYFFLCSMSSSFLWQSSGDPKATHRLQGRPPSHALCSFLQRKQASFILPLPLAGRKQQKKKKK